MPRILGALSLVLLLSAALPATTLQRMTIEELVAASPAIARVRCVSNEVRWDGGRIWTFSTMDVVEPMKGTLPQRIRLRLLGGKAGGLVSKVEGVPRFAPGEEAILFLQPSSGGDWNVVSWVQGTFRIHRHGRAEERVTQDTAGATMFNPATKQFEKGDVRNAPLSAFRARIDRAVSQAERARK